MIIGKGIDDINTRMPKDAYDTGKDMPTFNAYLTIMVRDSKGNVIKVHRQRSHSPTLNFVGLMLPAQYYINTNYSITMTGIGGASFNYQPTFSNNSWQITYPNANTSIPSYTSGIVVGSGQQTNPLSTIHLAAQIANGSGAGQLVYGPVSYSSNIIVSGNSAYFYISQTFTNQSGGTVTITEVGIIAHIQPTTASTINNLGNYTLLIWYDVLSSSISVPNGDSVTIYYTFAVNP